MLLRRLRDKARDVSPGLLLLRILDRMTPGFLFSANTLVVVAEDTVAIARKAEPDPEMRWGTPDDIDRMTAFGQTPEELRERFERGARPAIVERDGRMIAYEWLQHDSYSEDPWLRLTLSPSDAWSYDSFVPPESRRQGLNKRTNAYLCAECARNGRTRVLGVIILTNQVAMRVHLRRGYEIVGRVFFVRILGLSLVRAAGKTRIGWWTAARPLNLPVSDFDD